MGPGVVLMQRYRIELTEDEREELLGIVTRGKAAAATIAHANVLLAVDTGEHAELRMTSAQAAAAYHVSERTVDNVKRRLAEEGMGAALGRKPRSRPGNVKIDGEAEARIVALTCTDPPEGHARWTLRLIAERAVELGYVESISHVAVGNVLKKTRSSHGWSGSGASRQPPASS